MGWEAISPLLSVAPPRTHAAASFGSPTFPTALDSTVWTCLSDTAATRAAQLSGRSSHSPHFLLPRAFLWPAFLQSRDGKRASADVCLPPSPAHLTPKTLAESSLGAAGALRLAGVCTARRGFPDVGLPQTPPRPAPRSLLPLRAPFRALRLRSARAAAASRGCP